MVAAESRIRVRAPGKLFLLGEYAVLYGGPAIVMAVDRYVEVTAERGGDGDQTAIEVNGKGITMPPLTATLGDELIYRNASDEHRLIMTVLDGLVRHNVLHSGLGSIACTIDSRQLFHHGNKLGLGSSAAVTHGLVRALVDYAKAYPGFESPEPPPNFVFDLHQKFQQGKGSGADVAAGVMGDAFLFRRGSRHTLPQMQAVLLPDALQLAPVWAGQPASTTEALVSLAAFRDQQPDRFTTAMAPLTELAQEGVDALVEGDTVAFVQACDGYGHILSEFGRTVGVDIMSSAHRELRQIARSCEVVYKPSGAGNGDFGIGYSMDIKALSDFRQKAALAGYAPLDLGPGRPCHRI